jgi:peptidoglycan/LPS O-acetylase OafA/YrhL
VGLLGVCAMRVGYPTFTKTDPLHQALLYPGLALVYAAMVGWAFARSRDESLGGSVIVRWLKSGPMQLIGKVSYGIYVFHMPINMGMRHLGWHAQDSTVVGVAAFAWSLAYIAVLSVLSVGTAWASWHLFEKRVLKLKRFFEYRPAPASEVR